jgi:hypothetical protein
MYFSFKTTLNASKMQLLGFSILGQSIAKLKMDVGPQEAFLICALGNGPPFGPRDCASADSFAALKPKSRSEAVKGMREAERSMPYTNTKMRAIFAAT